MRLFESGVGYELRCDKRDWGERATGSIAIVTDRCLAGHIEAGRRIVSGFDGVRGEQRTKSKIQDGAD